MLDVGDMSLTICLYCIFLVSLKGFQYLGNANKKRVSGSGNGRGETNKSGQIKSMPSAPWVPLLGSLPFLGRNVPQRFRQWHRDGLGSIFRVKFGSREMVVLNDYESIRECLVRNSSSSLGRVQNKMVVDLWKGDGIIFLDYGAKWRTQHKFLHSKLRKILGKDNLHKMAFDETGTMIEAMRLQLQGRRELCGNYRKIQMNCKQNNCLCATSSPDSHRDVTQTWTCMNPNDFLHQMSLNIVCRTIFGRCFRREEKEYCDVMAETPIQARKSFAAFLTVYLVPFLRHVPPIRGIINEALQLREATFKMIREIVDDHVKDFHGANDESGLIDSYIDRILNPRGDEDDQYFTYSQLHATLFDIVTAGGETTASTVMWTLLFLANDPELLEEVRTEITEALGESSGQYPRHLSTILHLTRATIQETLRMRPIVPLSVGHQVNKDFTAMGYEFPKGTVILSNLWAASHDENEFPNPEEFNPKRHLDNSGAFHQNNHILAFSTGPRRCLGRPLAECNMLFILVRLLSNFEFRLPKVWNSRSRSYETATFDMSGMNKQIHLPPDYWLQWREIGQDVS